MNPTPSFRFRLYVAGDAGNSAQALSNLTAICQSHLPDRHHIELIDVLADPKRAHADGILLTPTLVKAWASKLRVPSNAPATSSLPSRYAAPRMSLSIGVLSILDRRDGRPYTPADLPRAEMLAGLAQAILA